MAPLPARKSREIILQMLYSLDMEGSKEQLIPLMMKEIAISKKKATLAINEAISVLEKKNIIDPIIYKNTKKGLTGHIQKLEYNILRLAIYEYYLKKTNLNYKIIITEAIRLTNKFSNAEATSFINAVLDKIFTENEKIN